MCGISGVYSFNDGGRKYMDKLPLAAAAMLKRGPDAGGFFYHGNIGLSHRRLSIIDTSAAANQPMSDHSGRYTIIFNGEIFNYRELKEQKLPTYQPSTSSDTEILLELYIRYGVSCLSWLNGFFAFAVYDSLASTVFIARDRFGKKPLLYFFDSDKFAFASEMKALLSLGLPKEIDYTSLYQYFQLNYIPTPATIFKSVQKLPPAHYLFLEKGQIQIKSYYQIVNSPSQVRYEEAQEKLVGLMDAAVKKRLIADVPLGAFLSGGIDSSVIVALASRHTDHLNTFSIGYKDEPFFDETAYANLVAKKCKTEHTVFSLTNDDFLQHLYDVLDYLDEPFADSSCLPSYILCKHTRAKATVALSGDGGDEVFAGYNKHAAEYKVRQHSLLHFMVKNADRLWKALPQSRNSRLANLFRQLHRFAEGSKLNVADRYYRWCSINTPFTAWKMLHASVTAKIDQQIFQERKDQITRFVENEEDFNQVLLADMNGLLVSNMMYKVDMMSMANSLEVRSPFLDVDVVNFAFTLEANLKIDRKQKKKIVQDAFRPLLPEELYNRPKKGFEIPLLNWFRNELQSLIEEDLLNDTFIKEQAIFDPLAIQALKQRLFSASPGDTHATIWQLIVFQYWWKKVIAG